MNLPTKFYVILAALIIAVLLFDLQVFLSIKQQKLEMAITPETYINHPKIGFVKLLTWSQPPQRVLGAETYQIESTRIPVKESYVVAAIGDSMVETMGDSLDYLRAELRLKYPATGFAFYNYGIGSENIEEALFRFDKPFDRGNRHHVSISDLHPDIIIVGSWAYNPLFPHNPGKYSAKFSEMISKVKATGAKVYVLSEIAPLSEGFGEGPGGVNWPNEIVKPHEERIIEGLQMAAILGKNMGVEIVDAFDKSKASGNFGRSDLVSSHDGIHPSILGEKFMASLIASAINLY